MVRKILNMRHFKAEPTWIIDQPIDFNSAVEELHGLGSQELNKILQDYENFTLQHCTEKGANVQINMERLARCLPVHLIAVLISSGGDEVHMQYLLRGFRLLHSFSDLVSRHNKLEQVLLEEVRVTEQIMDLIFYTIVVLARYKQDNRVTGLFPHLHSALVACSLYLLAGYVSSQWKDLVQVLVVHPEVDLFMDAAFNAVRIDILFLQIKLSEPKTDVSCNRSNFISVHGAAHNLCQQCEASLQFLQSLCQQKLFRERLLKNKELCKNGGILSLVQAVLNLDTPHFKEASKVAAAVSRMKSKVLSILLQLCETESISYLDEVASSPSSMELARFVALKVLKLLKTSFVREQQLIDCGKSRFPRGLVLLNTMRLIDIFSDDSNFRYFITINTTRVLAEMLLLAHEEFLTSWCSADLLVVEEDGSFDYDPFVAAGVVLELLSTGLTSTETNMECNFNLNSLPQASYAQHRTSLLVKIIANLHCFVPDICEEQERNLFFNKFLERLRLELPKSPAGLSVTSNAQNGAIVCKNLGSLLDYANSLIPTFLNEEDVHLLSKFFKELQSLVPSKIEGNLAQEHDQDIKFRHSLGCGNISNFDTGECNQETQSGGLSTSLTIKMDPKVREVSLDFRKSDYPKEGTSESLLYQENAIMVSRRNQKAETIASESVREIDKDPHNLETSGSEASSNRGKDSLDQLLDNGDLSKLAEHINESGLKDVEETDKSETTNGEDKQRRKRKRNIMNDKQITLIERALLDEPEMQRNAVLLQSWADKLSAHGSELTGSQLKNWEDRSSSDPWKRKEISKKATERWDNAVGLNEDPGKGCKGYEQCRSKETSEKATDSWVDAVGFWGDIDRWSNVVGFAGDFDSWNRAVGYWGDFEKGKEGGNKPWGSKATTSEKATDSWSNAIGFGEDPGKGHKKDDPWGSKETSKKATDNWGNAVGSWGDLEKSKEGGDDPWGRRATTSKKSTDSWSKAVVFGEDPGKGKDKGSDSWGSKDTGKTSTEGRKQATDFCGDHKSSWSIAQTGDRPLDAKQNRGDNFWRDTDGWDKGKGVAKNDEVGWGSATVAQDRDSWDKGKKVSGNDSGSVTQGAGNNGQSPQEDSWGKATESWMAKDSSIKSKPGWNQSEATRKTQNDSWAKPKAFGTDGATSWSKGTITSTEDGWHSQRCIDGDRGSDLNKGKDNEEGSTDNQQDGWSIPRNFHHGWRACGRRGRSGGRSGRNNDNHQSCTEIQSSNACSWERPDSWKKTNAFSWEQGFSWENSSVGTEGHINQGDGCDSKANSWESGAVAAGGNNPSGWGGTSGGAVDAGGRGLSGWGGTRGGALDAGGNKSSGWGSTTNWNSPKDLGGDRSSDWNLGVAANYGVGENKKLKDHWNSGKASKASRWESGFGVNNSSGWYSGSNWNTLKDSCGSQSLDWGQGVGGGGSSGSISRGFGNRGCGGRDQTGDWNGGKPHLENQYFGWSKGAKVDVGGLVGGWGNKDSGNEGTSNGEGWAGKETKNWIQSNAGDWNRGKPHEGSQSFGLSSGANVDSRDQVGGWAKQVSGNKGTSNSEGRGGNSQSNAAHKSESHVWNKSIGGKGETNRKGGCQEGAWGKPEVNSWVMGKGGSSGNGAC